VACSCPAATGCTCVIPVSPGLGLPAARPVVRAGGTCLIASSVPEAVRHPGVQAAHCGSGQVPGAVMYTDGPVRSRQKG
jgi:hypothetical protein